MLRIQIEQSLTLIQVEMDFSIKFMETKDPPQEYIDEFYSILELIQIMKLQVKHIVLPNFNNEIRNLEQQFNAIVRVHGTSIATEESKAPKPIGPSYPYPPLE